MVSLKSIIRKKILAKHIKVIPFSYPRFWRVAKKEGLLPIVFPTRGISLWHVILLSRGVRDNPDIWNF
jgi:hypothetical protein